MLKLNSKTKYLKVLVSYKSTIPLTSSTCSNSSLVTSNAVSVLNDKLAILSVISNDDYKKPLNKFYNSSISQHFRHSLDHYNKLINKVKLNNNINEIICYDERDRNNPVEKDKNIAILLTKELINKINNLTYNDLYKKVNIKLNANSNSNEDAFIIESNVIRELSFVSHHSVHHLSTIKLMLDNLSYANINQNIGIANSTQIHNKNNK
jgi:hypothetical protein